MVDKVEFKRQFIHFFAGIIFVILYYYGLIDKRILLIITTFFFLIFLVSRKIRIPPVEWFLKNFERPRQFPGKGLIFYMVGVTLCFFIFNKYIAMASVLILAIGDSIPNIVGFYSKKFKHPFSDRKYLEGMIAGIVFSSFAAMIFVSWYESLLGATVAMILEGIDLKIGLEKIDDNIIVPVSAGLVIYLIRLLV
jgi:dolichol kinase